MNGGDGRIVRLRPPAFCLQGLVLIGDSPLFQQVLSVVDSAAGNDCRVLFEGGSGTGKELLARRVRALSPRAERPFIPVSCPGIPESLFESQFFGHLRRSFTGATMDTLGIVRAEDGKPRLQCCESAGDCPWPRAKWGISA